MLPLQPERTDIEQASGTARADLGDEAFACAYQQGRTLGLNQLLDQLAV